MNAKNYNKYVENATKNLLDEQAKKRKDAKNNILDISPILFCHIIKCLMFGRNCYSYNHWCVEIYNWLCGMQNIKLEQNKKGIPYKDLEKWACDDWLDMQTYCEILETEMYTESAYNPIGFTELKNDYENILKLYKRLLLLVSNNEVTKILLKAEFDQWLNKHDITESKGE